MRAIVAHAAKDLRLEPAPVAKHRPRPASANAAGHSQSPHHRLRARSTELVKARSPAAPLSVSSSRLRHMVDQFQ